MQWIEKNGGQRPLFESDSMEYLLARYEYVGVRYAFIYEILHKLLTRFGFTSLDGKLLHDLVTIRIIEPASKLQSLVLIEEYFGITHRRQSFYESLPKFVTLKDAAEKLTVKRAKEEFGFDFSLVFYDVTTLYYESFEADDLRKPGFSKDSKSQQPQIVLGLVVNADGFPVSYEIFEGNKFEGHTLIPVIKAFKEKHGISTLTVVADAAMISGDNVEALEKNSLHYIVGARMGNISPRSISKISDEIGGKDKFTVRIKTDLRSAMVLSDSRWSATACFFNASFCDDSVFFSSVSANCAAWEEARSFCVLRNWSMVVRKVSRRRASAFSASAEKSGAVRPSASAPATRREMCERFMVRSDR